MHAGGPFSDPDVPVPVRPSRREARQARKRLNGQAWQEVPPAERVRLRTVVRARASVVNRRGGRIIAVRRDVTYGDADHGMHARSTIPALFPGGDFAYAASGSAGWIEPALFLLLGVAVIAFWLYRGPGRYLRRLRDRRDLRGSLTS